MLVDRQDIDVQVVYANVVSTSQSDNNVDADESGFIDDGTDIEIR